MVSFCAFNVKLIFIVLTLNMQLCESFNILSTNYIQRSNFKAIHMTNNFSNRISKTILKGFGACLISSTFLSTTTIADSGFQSQLQLIRQQQIESQKEATDRLEQELMSKEILYPEGKLIARGKVCLTPAKNGDFDRINFPFGLFKSTDLDEALDNDKATLFLLAVGREGPPVAAVKYKLKDLKFPFVFEITTDNLLYPYTTDAWIRSPNSKDTTAVTAIISLDEYLSTPSDSEWVAFGLSNPVVIAGVQSRASAELAVKSKIDKKLYSETEINSLAGIDRELAKLDIVPVETASVKVKK